MITGIVQARMGSSRLPGKVMKSAAGKTMFEHLVERVRAANKLQQIVLATTENPKDDPLCDLAAKMGVPVFRGSENDVLGRFLGAATEFGASVIVRLLNDCPLLDPSVVDQAIECFFETGNLDFISNQHPHTFPDGQDVSVFTFKALENLNAMETTANQREHVVPGFWETGAFKWQNFHNRVNLFKEHRWTLDFEADFLLISAVIESLYTPARVFTMEDVVGFLEKNPDIKNLNAHLIPRNINVSYT